MTETDSDCVLMNGCLFEGHLSVTRISKNASQSVKAHNIMRSKRAMEYLPLDFNQALRLNTVIWVSL